MIWMVLVSAYVLPILEDSEEQGEITGKALTRAYLCVESSKECEESMNVHEALVEELYPSVCPNWKPALTYLVYSVGYKTASEELKTLRELINSSARSSALPYLQKICGDLEPEVCEQLQYALALPCH